MPWNQTKSLIDELDIFNLYIWILFVIIKVLSLKFSQKNDLKVMFHISFPKRVCLWK